MLPLLMVMGGCALLAASTLVSMMANFIGRGGTDLAALILLQAAATPLLALLAVALLWPAIRRDGAVAALAGAARAQTGWTIFAFASLNSLVLLGEFSLLLVRVMSEQPVPWRLHVPLACGLAASLAFCTAFAAWRRAA